MPVVSTKGLKIWLQKADVTATPLEPTAISEADPPVITVADTAGIAVGDVAAFGQVGFAELNGKTLVIDAVIDATTFSVAGADTSDSTGTLAATPTINVYTADDMCLLCLSAIDVPDAVANPISVATFCNPAASVPGNPTPGTITFTGYVDVADPCYPEMLAAVDDGLPRVIKIDLPGGNGYFITTVIVGSVSYAIPLEGAVAFTFSGTQSVKLEHIF